MPAFTEIRTVAHSAQKMYQLVMDIEK